MFSRWKSKKEEQRTVQIIEIKSPLSGQAIALSKVPDDTFAGGHMGSGIAIEPVEGRLYAPFDGKIAHIVKTGHALIIEHASGLQLLLHIGIDTVSLKGSGFQSHAAAGDIVKAGQLLIEFDLEAIRTAGLAAISPMIVTSMEETQPAVECMYGQVTAGKDLILKVTAQ
ncbi:PTS sugar transporter subunit IIA [Paenibacillus sp. FSL R7-0331]|uniref:PTS sugar transporter subunit IIA n=1 Tax=Paenibacillus sp. FSL R7-0331 TaxID=1536773 RepID=UPI0004F6AB0F|nr:PTS glucose transporter subunit IIA [Paenibacillus sp. FSL R7-0331]AIQ52597.1 PTS glucose transporter subunit IIA [Paenibacillus sp. FSL R7-0331]